MAYAQNTTFNEEVTKAKSKEKTLVIQWLLINYSKTFALRDIHLLQFDFQRETSMSYCLVSNVSDFITTESKSIFNDHDYELFHKHSKYRPL